MFRGSKGMLRTQRAWVAAVVAGLIALGGTRQAPGQIVDPNLFRPQVGGVSVSVEGVLTNVDSQSRPELKNARQQAVQALPSDLSQPAKMRSVSLRKLDETIAECLKAGKPLPDEVKYLAGLQRAQYVFVYPDKKDVVIAGPAEGWKFNESGEVVGVNSGRPVLHLDDLLIALRYADSARRGGLSVSIDPTPEGQANLNKFLAKQKGAIGSNPQATFSAMEQAMGPQNITINGLPPTSRFANVMVAADYRMKRLGLKMDPAPVEGMKSYLETLAASGRVAANLCPRWWLSPRYEPLATDGEGTAWELRGPGVQALCEEDLVTSAGQRTKSVAASPASQAWADAMTNNYEALAAKSSVFGDLRNCMDLAVVGALIAKEHLLEKADLHPDCLLDEKQLATESYTTPKRVDSKASFLKKGRDWVIVVSGGVEIQPWEVVQETQKSDTIASTRKDASATGDRWYWGK